MYNFVYIDNCTANSTHMHSQDYFTRNLYYSFRLFHKHMKSPKFYEISLNSVIVTRGGSRTAATSKMERFLPQITRQCYPSLA